MKHDTHRSSRIDSNSRRVVSGGWFSTERANVTISDSTPRPSSPDGAGEASQTWGSSRGGGHTKRRSKQIVFEIAPSSSNRPGLKVTSTDERFTTVASADAELLEIDDVEDFDDEVTGTSQRAIESSTVSGGVLITADVAYKLRMTVFGEDSKSVGKFPDAWMKQGFHFDTETKDLGYGLVQFEGGPCGPIAAVQAHVLAYLGSTKEGHDSWRNPSNAMCRICLSGAISAILWRIAVESGRQAAVVALVDHDVGKEVRSRSYKGYRADGVTETLRLFTFSSCSGLESFLRTKSVIDQFTDKRGHGVVLLVYSAILSRGINRVTRDMTTVPGMTGRLMGRHDYAGQELVNLLLSGGAYSQVFDGVRTLEGTSREDSTTLYGVPKRCDVGFLTLFERYGYVEVGEHLKSPARPVWVVCSESHYSVLFCSPTATSRPTPSKDDDVELFYFDGLARQNEEIRLTVKANAGFVEKESSKKGASFGGDVGDDDFDDLVPPLDSCIRTKWKGAVVDWNDTEPLL